MPLLCAVILVLLLGPRIFAEEPPLPPPLRLNLLVQEVLDRSPDLSAAHRRVEAARLAAGRALTLEDPRLNIMSEDTPFRRDSGMMPMIRYELSQMFPFPGKRTLRGMIAEQGVEVARSEAVAATQELIRQTKRLYFALFVNQAARRINHHNREVLRRFVDAALIRYKAGTGAYSEVLKAQIEFQMLEDELLMLEQERTSMATMLSALRNFPPATPVGEPEETFTPPIEVALETLEHQALAQRAELRGMAAMVREQRAMAALARREFYPDLMFSLLYQQVTRGGEDGWGVGVGINIPIWIEKKQKREEREAEARAEAAQSTLIGMETMIRAEIHQRWAALQTIERRIALFRDGLIPTTVETLASIETKYRAGTGEFLMLLDTRRQLQNLELAYERARAEREIALADLERAAGGPMGDAP